MGYTTDFRGSFNLNKKLDQYTYDFLNKLAQTRRMKRKFPDDNYGVDGEFYVDGEGDFGQERDSSIVDYNRPPSTQPGLWCQWIPTTDKKSIEHDGGEKFYHYIEWIEYIIKAVLEPKGYILNGIVEWRGEEWDDNGTITIDDNIVTTN